MSAHAQSLVEAAKSETGDGPLFRALMALAEGRILGAFTTSVVFRPGLPTSAPCYATWAEVLAVLASTPGPKVVFFDDENAACTIPAGTITKSLGPLTFAGVSAQVTSLVTLAAGVIFEPGALYRIHDLQVVPSNTATPNILIDAAIESQVLYLSGHTNIQPAGTQPFLSVTGGAGRQAEVLMSERAQVSTGATAAFKVSTALSRLDISLADHASIASNALAYAATTVGDLILNDESSVSATQAGSPNYTPDAATSTPTRSFGGSFHQAFTNADLVANVLTVTHNLGTPYVAFDVYSNVDRHAFEASGFTSADVSANTLTITFPGAIAGTWHVVVRR